MEFENDFQNVLFNFLCVSKLNTNLILLCLLFLLQAKALCQMSSYNAFVKDSIELTSEENISVDSFDFVVVNRIKKRIRFWLPLKDIYRTIGGQSDTIGYSSEDFYNHLYGKSEVANNTIIQNYSQGAQLFTTLYEGTIWDARVKLGTLFSMSDSTNFINSDSIRENYSEQLLNNGANFTILAEFPFFFSSTKYHTSYANAEVGIGFFPKGFTGNPSTSMTNNLSIQFTTTFHPIDKSFGLLLHSKFTYNLNHNNFQENLGLLAPRSFVFGQFNLGILVGNNLSFILSIPFELSGNVRNADSENVLAGIQFRRNLNK